MVTKPDPQPYPSTFRERPLDPQITDPDCPLCKRGVTGVHTSIHRKLEAARKLATG